MDMVSTKPEPETSEPMTYDGRPRIHLDDDLIEKLGLTGVPTPGATYTLQAVAVAESVSARLEEPDEGESGAPDVCMCLVLTEIGLTPAGATPASVLYGD